MMVLIDSRQTRTIALLKHEILKQPCDHNLSLSFHCLCACPSIRHLFPGLLSLLFINRRFHSNCTVTPDSLCLLPWLPWHGPFLVFPFVSMASYFQSAFLASLFCLPDVDELLSSALHNALSIVPVFAVVLIRAVIIFAYTFSLIS